MGKRRGAFGPLRPPHACPRQNPALTLGGNEAHRRCQWRDRGVRPRLAPDGGSARSAASSSRRAALRSASAASRICAGADGGFGRKVGVGRPSNPERKRSRERRERIGEGLRGRAVDAAVHDVLHDGSGMGGVRRTRVDRRALHRCLRVNTRPPRGLRPGRGRAPRQAARARTGTFAPEEDARQVGEQTRRPTDDRQPKRGRADRVRPGQGKSGVRRRECRLKRNPIGQREQALMETGCAAIRKDPDPYDRGHPWMSTDALDGFPRGQFAGEKALHASADEKGFLVLHGTGRPVWKDRRESSLLMLRH